MATNLACYIVDDDGSSTASVVHGGETVVLLLACSVPNLKLNLLVAKLNSLNFEVDAYGGNERRRKLIVRVSQQDATLSHSFDFRYTRGCLSVMQSLRILFALSFARVKRTYRCLRSKVA